MADNAASEAGGAWGPTDALMRLVAASSEGTTSAEMPTPVGMIRSYATKLGRYSAPIPDGRVLARDDYPELYAAIRGSYGETELGFTLPNLVVRPAIGHGQPVPETLAPPGQQPGVPLTYLICAEGAIAGSSEPTPQTVGMVMPYLGEGEFRGWLVADGRLVSVAMHPALFATIGTRFGGDGQQNFGLPDLRGRTPIGADDLIYKGRKFYLPSVGPALGLPHLITITGVVPEIEGNGTIPFDSAALGEVLIFAGETAPDWLIPADGRELGSHSMALEGMLAADWGMGPNGRARVPDLRRKAVVAQPAPPPPPPSREQPSRRARPARRAPPRRRRR